MDDYSDDESLTDYTETKVLLGYAEEEAGSDTISHLGGEPVWLHPDSPADARLAKCANCNRLMTLLLQLNGAIEQSPHERMFYVFACKEKTCRRKKGTVRAIRGVKVSKDWEEKVSRAATVREEERRRSEERRKVEAAKPKAGDLLFGNGGLGNAGGVNPFSTGSSGGANPFSTSTAAAQNPFSTKPATQMETLAKSFADALKISQPVAEPAPEPLLYGPSEPWPSPLPHKFPLFYLDADYETLVPEKPMEQKMEVLMDEGSGSDTLPVSSSDADDGHLDVAFQKFADRAGQNPEQVLRYERGGTPLLYSYDDDVAKTLLDSRKDYSARKIPACSGCGKRDRVFEFQLMPHAISVLEGDSLSLDGMEWGTILVGTCTCVPKVRDANGVGWVEEWVGVQWEAQK
ncbi:programmed cell death protein 2 [Sphaerosporella brunnea]|uniref:Programmed cell death protein 2 n=1 Tax=Sphaerosporella brunnea TaxID=1250544 RepID=A0A5J5F2M5_9PEZI|nr:programmed cell death protein 2 [Sphaerosporella brunnea]